MCYAFGLLVATCGIARPHVRLVDRVTAYTTLSLWHELYVSRGEAHDFADAFAPALDGQAEHQHFIAAVHMNRIRALARLERQGLYRSGFNLLAHGPGDDELCEQFIAELVKSDHPPMLSALRDRQLRWYLACLFVSR